jgi:hypothetical protein
VVGIHGIFGSQFWVMCMIIDSGLWFEGSNLFSHSGLSSIILVDIVSRG